MRQRFVGLNCALLSVMSGSGKQLHGQDHYGIGKISCTIVAISAACSFQHKPVLVAKHNDILNLR